MTAKKFQPVAQKPPPSSLEIIEGRLQEATINQIKAEASLLNIQEMLKEATDRVTSTRTRVEELVQLKQLLSAQAMEIVDP